MTTDEQILKKVSKLTENQKKEVDQFVNELLEKAGQTGGKKIFPDIGKGLAEMSDDFDEPFEDFRDYME